MSGENVGGVEYGHRPEEFRGLLAGVFPFLSIFGKGEFEIIACKFVKKAVRTGEWPTLKVADEYYAEEMVRAGYLRRCSPPVRSPRGSGRARAGTYQITNEALETILREHGKAGR